MVLSELAVRLNCAEYKNWVKAGHCLLLLRRCLQGFVGREMLAFHRGLLACAPGLGPAATCRGGARCNPRARQVSIRPRALTAKLPHLLTRSSPSPAPHPLPFRAQCPAASLVRGLRCPNASPSPPPHAVSASVSGVRRVETGDSETSHQQKRRRPLGQLPAGPLARGRLGGGQGEHLRPRGWGGVTPRVGATWSPRPGKQTQSLRAEPQGWCLGGSGLCWGTQHPLGKQRLAATCPPPGGVSVRYSRRPSWRTDPRGRRGSRMRSEGHGHRGGSMKCGFEGKLPRHSSWFSCTLRTASERRQEKATAGRAFSAV